MSAPSSRSGCSLPPAQGCAPSRVWRPSAAHAGHAYPPLEVTSAPSMHSRQKLQVQPPHSGSPPHHRATDVQMHAFEEPCTNLHLSMPCDIDIVTMLEDHLPVRCCRLVSQPFKRGRCHAGMQAGLAVASHVHALGRGDRVVQQAAAQVARKALCDRSHGPAHHTPQLHLLFFLQVPVPALNSRANHQRCLKRRDMNCTGDREGF